MPLIQELPATESKISVDDSDAEKEKEDEEEDKGSKKPSQERTFLTFSDFETFRRAFPKGRRHRQQQQQRQQGPALSSSQPPHAKICPITRLPAKYFDPVTRLPYANLQAFKILREAYYVQLEAKGNKGDPEVAAWVEWRQKNRPQAQGGGVGSPAAAGKPAFLSQVRDIKIGFFLERSSKLNLCTT